jgi:hypothetical protein
VKATIGQTWSQIMSAPFPLSRIPRTSSRKCVSGRTLPTSCAHSGMPRNGNMKPESSIDGRKKKKVICIACNWFWAMRAEGDAERQVGADEQQYDRVEQQQAAVHRHVEKPARGQEDQRHLDQPDDDVRHDLAGHHLDGRRRRREKVLESAALALAGHRQAGHEDHGHGQDHAQQTGYDVVGGEAFRVVATVDAQFDRRRGRTPQARQVRCKDLEAEILEYRDGATGGHRVGGVGFDQQRRALAAHQVAVEAGREGDDELDLATLEEVVGLLLVHLADNPEIVAVGHGGDVGPRERPGVDHDHGGGQVFRVGIDRKAEEQQLDDRDADDHSEGQSVALELDELLEQDADPAREREAWHASQPANGSSACCMRWMKASSSEGATAATCIVVCWVSSCRLACSVRRPGR